MAGQADGTVYVDTELDTKGFAAGSAELRQAIKSLNSRMEALGPTLKKAVSGNMEALSQFNSEAEALREAIGDDVVKLSALGATRLPTDEYARICAETEKAGQALERLLNRQEKMQELGVSENSKQWKSLQYDLDQTAQKYDQLEAIQSQMEASGTAFHWGNTTSQYTELWESLDAVREELSEMQSQVSGLNQKMGQSTTLSGMVKNAFAAIGSAIQDALLSVQDFVSTVGTTIRNTFSAIGNAVTHPIQTIDRFLGTLITTAGRAAMNLAKMAGGSIISGLKKVASTAKQAAVNLAKMAGSAVSSGLKKIVSGVKQAAFSLLGLNKSSSKASGGLSGGLKTMLKYGLGIRSLYVLVNKLKSALVDGFQNLAQYSDSTNSAISSLQTALTTLKNSFAAAFSPILTTVAPILTKLINLLSSAISYVGAFVAALTGSKTYTKAVAVQEDYAASLSGTADAANDAADAAEEAKRQLAGFDELNILSDSSSNSSSGSGGGSSDPSSMFEEVEMPSGISDFVENLKELFANGEYEEIGHLIADGLNSALQFVDDWINNTLRPMGVKWADIAARVLNGLVDGFDWDTLGKTVSDGINSIFDILNTFLATFDFVSFGEGIGEGLAGAIKNLDTESIGSVLAYKVKGLLESAAGMVNSFSDSGGWAAIGEKLAEYANGWVDTLRSIDWASVGDAIGNFVMGIPETIISFLQKTDWKGLAEGLSTSIIDLCSGLADKFENYDWRKMGGNLVSSIVTAITDFFGNIDWGGVASSAAEMIGAFVGGAAAAVAGLGETLWNDYILPAWNSLVDWWNDTACEDGQFTIQGLLDGISEALANIGTWIKEHIFQPFIDGFKKAFGISSPSTVMAEQGGYIVAGLLNGITSCASSIIAIPGKIKGWITGKFSDAKDWLKEKGTNIITGLKNGMESAKTVVQNVAGSIKGWVTEKLSSASSWLKGKGKDVIAGMKSGMEDKQSLLSNTASKVKGWITDKLSNWSSAKTWGSDLCANLASGISNAVSKVKDAVSGVADKIKSLLGFSEPEEGPLSDFHTYMPDMIKLMVKGIKANEDAAINAVSNMADAIADEMNNGSYALKEIVPATEVNGAIESFTDKITDSFSSMLNKLQAIAESVTFTVPAVATGAVPYKAATAAASGGMADLGTTIEASNDELASVVTQVVMNAASSIVTAIQNYSGTTVNLDKTSMAEAVIQEINRRTRMTNSSPLIG